MLLGDEPRQAVARRERVGEAAAAGELDGAVERIAGVDGLDLDERALGSAPAAARPCERKSTISETAAACASIQARSSGSAKR